MEYTCKDLYGILGVSKNSFIENFLNKGLKTSIEQSAVKEIYKKNITREYFFAVNANKIDNLKVDEFDFVDFMQNKLRISYRAILRILSEHKEKQLLNKIEELEGRNKTLTNQLNIIESKDILAAQEGNIGYRTYLKLLDIILSVSDEDFSMIKSFFLTEKMKGETKIEHLEGAHRLKLSQDKKPSHLDLKTWGKVRSKYHMEVNVIEKEES